MHAIAFNQDNLARSSQAAGAGCCRPIFPPLSELDITVAPFMAVGGNKEARAFDRFRAARVVVASIAIFLARVYSFNSSTTWSGPSKCRS